MTKETLPESYGYETPPSVGDYIGLILTGDEIVAQISSTNQLTGFKVTANNNLYSMAEMVLFGLDQQDNFPDTAPNVDLEIRPLVDLVFANIARELADYLQPIPGVMDLTMFIANRDKVAFVNYNTVAILESKHLLPEYRSSDITNLLKQYQELWPTDLQAWGELFKERHTETTVLLHPIQPTAKRPNPPSVTTPLLTLDLGSKSGN